MAPPSDAAVPIRDAPVGDAPVVDASLPDVPMVDAPLPAGSPFATGELRVDKLADNVEIASVEAGGWIKKSDKLVPYKLGRYFVTRVSVGGREGDEYDVSRATTTATPG